MPIDSMQPAPPSGSVRRLLQRNRQRSDVSLFSAMSLSYRDNMAPPLLNAFIVMHAPMPMMTSTRLRAIECCI